MDGQPDSERRPFVFAVADCADGSFVKLCQFTHNREPEPKASMVSRCRGIRLTESIENIGEEFGFNANA